MKKLNFDSGIVEYRIAHGGALRFNPTDPNLYGRFLEAEEKFKSIEQALSEKAACAQDSRQVLALLTQADQQLKQLLGWVFGGDNDFDKALAGVNLLATAADGQPVVTNLFAALEQILTAGAKAFADGEVAKAKARRGANG